MKCSVCGAESGKYPLCRSCNTKRKNGEIIKCTVCNNWHYANLPCPNATLTVDYNYLYEAKKHLISKTEQSFFSAIKNSVSDSFYVFPQINLAAFIKRTDGARFQNELFRNVDFLITDAEYSPKAIIEINDQTHNSLDRKERDEKVQKICEEAGIPVLKLWTSYGVNQDYIKKRVFETLNQPSFERIHHFSKPPVQEQSNNNDVKPAVNKKGCYIATCVYGSYDCPQVCTLRRYRDTTLSSSWYGRIFIQLYYSISPWLVKVFGNNYYFKKFWQKSLDKMVKKLNDTGVMNSPYTDR